MGKVRWTVLLGAAALLLAGCSVGPLQDNPVLIPPGRFKQPENPLYVPQGPLSYSKVFEKTLDVVDSIFPEIAYSNRYDGRIETFPYYAPGLEQPWKPGSPSFYERLLAFLQSVRYRCIVLITTADDGGYFIDVKVYKELEDVPTPVRSTAGMASFRNFSTVERQFEVIEPTVYEVNWIPIGRETALEQVILRRLASCDLNDVPQPKPSQDSPTIAGFLLPGG
jgi:hypothetical protein